MNPKVIADYIKQPLIQKGWVDARLADSLEPRAEVAETPLALVLRGVNLPRGETRYDNFVGQVEQEFFGIQIVAARDELDQRRDELFSVLLGKNLPGRTFPVQFSEGRPLTINRATEWWLDMYFTEIDRRQSL